MSSLAIALEVLLACAPQVAPETVERIIQVESGGNPLALNVNGTKLHRQPQDAADAVVLARHYLDHGYSVDLGLMQVNSDNLVSLGYTVEDMFETCKNLDAGARILTAHYNRARAEHDDEQHALRAALSAYNTGSFSRGFDNGYVARYFTAPLPAQAAATAADPNLAGTAIFVRQRSLLQEEQTTTAEAPSSVAHPDLDAEMGIAEVTDAPAPVEQAGPAPVQSTIGDVTTASVPVDDQHATAIMVAGKSTWRDE